MNWPSTYKLIGDSLIADISLPEEGAGIILLNRDPRKLDEKADCYVGKVLEVGSQCKLAKPGDQVVFVRWVYSQSNVDDDRICFREVDLVVVNEKTVNGYVAVKLYEPFKKAETLIKVEKKREIQRYFFGQIIDIDKPEMLKETKDLKEGDIIAFQYMDDYQYRVGQHTMLFKNLRDVITLKLEEAEVPKVLEVVNA